MGYLLLRAANERILSPTPARDPSPNSRSATKLVKRFADMGKVGTISPPDIPYIPFYHNTS